MSKEPNFDTPRHHPTPTYGGKRSTPPWKQPQRPEDIEQASEFTGEGLRGTPTKGDRS